MTQAANDGKKIIAVIVLGLTNDVKFCADRAAGSAAGEYPRDVTSLMEQMESVLGGWGRRLDAPVIYVGAAASAREDPRRQSGEVRLNNLSGEGARRQHAKALARIHNRLESLSSSGAWSTMASGKVYYAQKPMTDINRCDWVGHPAQSELYLQACLVRNTMGFVLQKGGLRRDLKCKLCRVEVVCF